MSKHALLATSALLIALGVAATGEAPDPVMTNPEAALLARISGVFDVEDPSSIYDFSVTDKEVEFIVDGSWSVNLESTATISLASGTPVYGFTPPVFTQTVDLKSWIFLDHTWYFESSFAEGFTKNTVAAGYLGDENTAVKHVRVGNSGISFPSVYPFIQVGGGIAIAPGAMGTFEGKNWNADAVVRYDAAATDSLLLSGMNEVTDVLVSAVSPLRGKWFVLPDAPVTGTVKVYVEDTDGSIQDSTGRKWRKLDQSEFTVSGIKGVVELSQAQSGCVAVMYGSRSYPGLDAFVGDTADYFSVAASATKRTMPDDYLPSTTTDIHSRFLLSLDGSSALLVRERGLFSPFDAGMRYQADGSEYELVYAESGVKPEGFAVTSYDSKYAELYRDDSATQADIREPEARFPLASEFPYLYLPAYGGLKPDTDLSIRSRSYTPLSDISLGSDVIAGTIQVTRNGVADTAFRFDEESGILQLDKAPRSSETIRITWYKTDTSARNGTLTVAGGVRWKASKELELSAANALRWNLSKDGYTDSSETSPGSYILSTGASWKTEPFGLSTSFAFEVQLPDTTGYYRVIGMDATVQTLYPSSDWYTTVASTITPVLGDPDVSSAVTLLPSNYVTPEGVDGSAMPTLTTSSVTGSVLVLHATLSSSDSWTGATIATGTEGGAELSVTRSITLSLRNPGDTANFDLYLQLGVKSDSTWENEDTIQTEQIAVPSAGSSWTTVSFTLSDSERAWLSAGSDMRVIAVPKAGGYPVEVNMQFGPIELNETDFASDSSSATLSEVSDPLTGLSGSLSSIDSSVINRFNSGSVNSVLKAELRPATDDEEIRILKTVSAIPTGSYQKLSFYMYGENIPPDGSPQPTLSVCLTAPDSDGSGTDTACAFRLLRLSSLKASSWNKVTVDFVDREVSVNDSVLSSSDAEITSINRSVSPTKVAVTFSSWPNRALSTDNSWVVYLDEFYLADSIMTKAARNLTEISWKKSGPLVSLGRTAILSNPSLSAKTETSVVIGDPEINASGNASAGVSIFGSRVDGSVGVTNTGDRTLETESHSVSVPAGPAAAAEDFAADFSSGTMSRSDSFSVSGPVAISGKLSESQSGKTLERTAGLTLSPKSDGTQFGVFSLSAGIQFAQTGTSPFPVIGDEQWDRLWEKSFRSLLSCGETDAKKRTGTTTVGAGWEHEGHVISAIKVNASGTSTYQSGSSTYGDSAISYTLAVPLAFDGFALTPQWKRTASQRKNLTAGGTWISDTDALAASIGTQPWLFTTLPFIDLFETSIADRIADNGPWSRTFSNAWSLDWTRPSPGVLADLWTPSTMGASVKRLTETDSSASNIRDNWSGQLTAGFSALNVAGTSGSLAVFSWYDQDEISQLYGWTPQWGAGYFTWSADTWHSVTLFFADSGTFSADNAWHYDSPDVSGENELTRDTVRLVWKRSGQRSFLIAPISHFTDIPLKTRREDSLSFSVTQEKPDLSSVLTYNHQLITKIGKNGEVKLTGGTSFTSTEDGLQTIEITIGLGGTLSY